MLTEGHDETNVIIGGVFLTDRTIIPSVVIESYQLHVTVEKVLSDATLNVCDIFNEFNSF